MRLLVVDDDEDFRALIGLSLETLRHESVMVASGADALDRLRAEKFQVLITDWNMPGMTGLDLCRRVRAETPEIQIYIILLTAMSGSENLIQALDSGADDFITKPYDEGQLAARLRVVERTLGLRKEVQQLVGLLPVCSYCRKVRTDDQQWLEMEKYLARSVDTTITHGICPSCFQSVIKPQMDAWKRTQGK